MSTPSLSLITVVKNDVHGLTSTLSSVGEQDFLDYEHIIVDGLSQDGSFELAKAHSPNSTKVISEKDKGIYDAMNKALSMAEGKWVLFLNAGDAFVDAHSLKTWMKYTESSFHLIYADVIRFDDEQNESIWPQKPFYQWGWYRNICHQAQLLNLEKIEKIHYDLDYPVSADFHFLLSLIIQKEFKAFKVDQTFIRYKVGGYSQTHAMKALKERWSSFDTLLDSRWLKYWNCFNLSRQMLRLYLSRLF